MKSRTVKIILAAVLIAAALIVLFWDYVYGWFQPAPSVTPPAQTATFTPIPTITLTPTATPTPTAMATPEPTPTPTPTIMPRWSELLEETPDIVGWLKLDGCDIDYAIVQGEDNSFYLDHSLDGSYKYEGWLFLGVEGDVLENKKNLVIHGHNMANGRMFGNLSRYDVTRGENAALKFYKENPTFTFDTLYEENEYKILSVMMVDVDENPFFNYLYNTFASDTVFDRFCTFINRRSMFTTGVDVNSDDELVMLSTCTAHWQLENGRLVVVGRKVREGEDPTVDTENVTINENVLMPKAWYQLYGGTEPTFDD